MGCRNRFTTYAINYNNSYKCENNNMSNGNCKTYITSGMMTTLNNINSSITIQNNKNINIMAYILISSVAIACYLNGINGDFVHDDIPAIMLNRDVTGTNKLSKLFLNDFWGTPMDDVNSHKSYRPLTTVTFRMNYYFFGFNAVWYHLTNILMHAIVCILFTRVCIIVAGLQSNFAIAAGLLFAVHPIHTEAVTGIVGRADVLACIFFLISLLLYHGNVFRSDDTSTILSIIFGGISMLSKETGITVFIVNLSFDLYRTWPSLKRAMIEVHWTPESQHCYRRLLKLLVSVGILLVIRLALLRGSFPKFSQQDNPTAYHPNFHVRMLTFCYLAAFNWWLLLCPVNLSHDWQMGSIPLLTSFSDPRNLLTLWAFLSTMLMLYKSILDFENQRYAPLTLGVLMLILPFLPATNLFVTVGFVVAERVLYIPSLGCILLVAYGAQILWESINKYRSCIILMGVLLITVSSCRTVTRNRDWCSREYLLRAGLRVLPHNAKMHYNFGNFLKDSFQHDMAKTHYREALRLWPTYASAHNNLGTLVNNFEIAERHFLSAIMYASTHVNAHFNLAQLYIKRNRSHDAVRMLKRCTQLDGSHMKAHIELIKLHPGIEASRIFQNAIEMNPYKEDLRIFFGRWLYERGFATAALNMFRWVLRRNESNKIAMRGVCRCYRKMGQLSRLHTLITRIQTDHHSTTEIYMRNWNIRAELQRRAYMYDLVNGSSYLPEIAMSSSLNKNLPTVLMQSDNRFQRKASVSSKVEATIKICSVVERSLIIVSTQNLQTRKIIFKFGKKNRTYNLNNLKRVLNEKQYRPDILEKFQSELSKNSIGYESNKTSMRIFYSNAAFNVSNNYKRTNQLCEDTMDKIVKLNRNDFISKRSIRDDFYSKSVNIKNKFKIKQNYKHTPPKLKAINKYYSLL